MLNKNITLLLLLASTALLSACGAGLNGAGIASTDVTNIINNKPNYICDTSNPEFRIPNRITNDYSIGPGCFYTNEYVIVTNTAQLTIQPDTILQFSASAGLAIDNGNVVANGTASKPIYFTSEFQNVNNSWVGIEVTDRNNDFRGNSFKYTVIEYAGANRPQLDNTSASISFHNSLYNGENVPRTIFTHNIIRNSVGQYAFLAAEYSFFDVIENNIFYDNYNFPISININESFKLDKTNRFTYDNKPNGNNKLVITGDSLNVVQRVESQQAADFNAQLQTRFYWEDLGLPYLIENDINVASTSLYIEAGVRLEFKINAGLKMDGNGASLFSQGSADRPVVMTSADMNNNPNIEQNWLGLHFSKSSNNLLEYTQVTNAGSLRDDGTNSNVAITNESKVIIKDSILSGSLGYGLHLDKSSKLSNDFQNNQLINNRAGIAEISILNASFLTNNNTYGNGFGDTISDTVSLIATDQLTATHSINRISVPYIIQSSTLAVTGNLEIEAGSTLLFRSFALFSIKEQGTLRAIGTAAAPITFGLISRLEDPLSPDYWQGLLFSNTTDPRNYLTYLTIDYAGHNQAPIKLFRSYLTVDNTIIQNISPNSTFSIDVSDSESQLTEGNGNFFLNPTNAIGNQFGDPLNNQF